MALLASGRGESSERFMFSLMGTGSAPIPSMMASPPAQGTLSPPVLGTPVSRMSSYSRVDSLGGSRLAHMPYQHDPSLMYSPGSGSAAPTARGREASAPPAGMHTVGVADNRALSPMRSIVVPTQPVPVATNSARVVVPFQRPIAPQPFLHIGSNLDAVVADLKAQVATLHVALQAESGQREQLGKQLGQLRSDFAAQSTLVSNQESQLAQLQTDVKQMSEEKEQMQGQMGQMQQFENDLSAQLNGAQQGLQSEAEARSATDEKVEECQQELETLKAHLSEFDYFSQSDLQRSLHRIERRGNIQINFETGDIRLLRPIAFAPRTTRDAPTAEFVRSDEAAAICIDLAEVMNLFQCPARIEGHTKGGEGEFWQTLADERARMVVQKIVEAGAEKSLITPCGKPGKTGDNETKVVVHLEMPDAARTQVRRSSAIAA